MRTPAWRMKMRRTRGMRIQKMLVKARGPMIAAMKTKSHLPPSRRRSQDHRVFLCSPMSVSPASAFLSRARAFNLVHLECIHKHVPLLTTSPPSHQTRRSHPCVPPAEVTSVQMARRVQRSLCRSRVSCPRLPLPVLRVLVCIIKCRRAW